MLFCFAYLNLVRMLILSVFSEERSDRQTKWGVLILCVFSDEMSVRQTKWGVLIGDRQTAWGFTHRYKAKMETRNCYWAKVPE